MKSKKNIDTNKKSRKYFIQYNKDNFSMYNIWVKEFSDLHKIIFYYLEEDIQNYYQLLDKKFFDWLNENKNISKFMFEIKKEFMAIANDVLLHVLLQFQLKKTENYFVIGLFQKYLEIIANEDADISLDLYNNADISLDLYNNDDIDIDSYPDMEPSYNLLEGNNGGGLSVIDENYENYENDKYYRSFFI